MLPNSRIGDRCATPYYKHDGGQQHGNADVKPQELDRDTTPHKCSELGHSGFANPTGTYPTHYPPETSPSIINITCRVITGCLQSVVRSGRPGYGSLINALIQGGCYGMVGQIMPYRKGGRGMVAATMP